MMSSSSSSNAVASSLLHLSHPSTTSEAAKRQAREYALRVQQFRDQQRKVASARSVPAATVQYSINKNINAKKNTNKDGGAEEEDDDDDPLSNLFSNIGGPRLKNMTRPLPASANVVPALFSATQGQSTGSGDEVVETSTSRKKSPLPNVVVASGKNAAAASAAFAKKRPPSPTRKTTSLSKIKTTTIDTRSSSSPDLQLKKYFFGAETSISDGAAGENKTESNNNDNNLGLKLHVPQLEIDISSSGSKKKKFLKSETTITKPEKLDIFQEVKTPQQQNVQEKVKEVSPPTAA
ncbi:unnamed protein product, partial [Rotaria socialis]